MSCKYFIGTVISIRKAWLLFCKGTLSIYKENTTQNSEVLKAKLLDNNIFHVLKLEPDKIKFPIANSPFLFLREVNEKQKWEEKHCEPL